MGKPYMPLMMGDWIKGTRGMRADVKGVYIGLLIHQYDHGSIPSELEDLLLIEPEVGKVWVSLEAKFPIAEPGQRKNLKLEEVREFWSKQGKNGSKGGRPRKNNPKQNPDNNPDTNPKHNHHNDLDLDNDLELKIKGAFDEIYLEQQSMKWPHLNFAFEFNAFCEKVRGSPDHYREHDTGGLRLAFQSQLRNAKKPNHATSKVKHNTADLAASFAARVSADATSQQFQGG